MMNPCERCLEHQWSFQYVEGVVTAKCGFCGNEVEWTPQKRHRAAVVHCKISKYDVYIGRPSEWGNPFSHKTGTLAEYKVDTVEEAITKYREWLLAQPLLVKRARFELRGKVLGCWCKTPKNPTAPCHGDVLMEIANEE